MAIAVFCAVALPVVALAALGGLFVYESAEIQLEEREDPLGEIEVSFQTNGDRRVYGGLVALSYWGAPYDVYLHAKPGTDVDSFVVENLYVIVDRNIVAIHQDRLEVAVEDVEEISDSGTRRARSSLVNLGRIPTRPKEQVVITGTVAGFGSGPVALRRRYLVNLEEDWDFGI